MILGILVTYNPNISSLEKNIYSILQQTDKLIIFDNASDNISSICNFIHSNKIQIYKNKNNIGLSGAYNFILKNHIAQYDFFVTFDQDTFIRDNLIKDALRFFNIDKSIRIVAPKFNFSQYSKNEFSYADAVIQSSTIFSSKLVKEIGLFDESYFIDSVDFEYCLRARSNGFKILQLNNIFINHELGFSKKSLGIKFFTHNYTRNFYIARNHVSITKKYFFRFPKFILKKNIFIFLHILKLLFLERSKIKLKYFFCGLINSKNKLNIK
jgi:rhamnosyltransferase